MPSAAKKLGSFTMTRAGKSMPMQAKKLVDRGRDDETAARIRARAPEELRLLEALLFAAGEPLDESDAWRAAAGRRRRASDALARLQAEYATRGVNLVQIGKQVDLPHRQRSVLAADQGDGRNAQAVARRDRDARHHRLSPAGDARRDRGHPRRRDRHGHARRAAQDRLDPAARPPQGAGPAADLRHHRGIPVAFRAGGGRRSAGPRRTQGRRACSRATCRRASPCRCRRTTPRCARTRIRWSRAISILAWRRRRSAPREVATAREVNREPDRALRRQRFAALQARLKRVGAAWPRAG